MQLRKNQTKFVVEIMHEIAVQRNNEGRILLDSLFYDIKDIQQLMNIGHSTAYKLVQLKGFPKMKLGSKVLIPKDDFEKWIQENKNNIINI